MNVSIASYAFHGLHSAGKMDVFGYLETCRYRYHLTTADIWNGFFPTLDYDFLEKVKEELETRDMTLENLCVDGPHIWDDDEAVREQHYQQALEYLQAAKFLNAKTIRVDAGGQGDEFSQEQFDLVVKRYREYAQIAYDLGFKVGPENHWGPENVPDNMVRICQAVDHPGFGVLLHFKSKEGDKKIAPWAVHTHISWEATHDGLAESMAMLRDAGYQGCWSVEHHSGKNEYHEVSVQLASVQNILAQW